MSSEFAIKINNLSKCYQIYDHPQDRLKQFIYPRLQRFSGQDPKQFFREFWALKDVSIEIKKGESIGIVGRNGSGKSTLLQMICGMLNPTSGSIQTKGRIAALLELGSGFNPEFTGRDNVYMNAGILGLTREEVDQRFEDIARFADIGAFLEQPIKTYSSGMVMRLAFAVVVHVDADILVIDEALAVGDAIFVQKCMRFIRKFMKDGTIIFVSHDMGSVINLCQKAIWLRDGRNIQSGDSKTIGEAYLQYTLQEVYGDDAELKKIEKTSQDVTEHEENMSIDYTALISVSDHLTEANGWKTGVGEIYSVQFESLNGNNDAVFKGGEKVRLGIHARALQTIENPILGFIFRDRLGQELFGENTLPYTNLNPVIVEADLAFQAEFIFKLPMLPNGEYSITIALADGDLYNHVQHHWLHDAFIVNVFSSKVRFGLVGVEFENVKLRLDKDE
jgi:lipopolysaccharide transport system ATP-binding protein